MQYRPEVGNIELGLWEYLQIRDIKMYEVEGPFYEPDRISKYSIQTKSDRLGGLQVNVTFNFQVELCKESHIWLTFEALWPTNVSNAGWMMMLTSHCQSCTQITTQSCRGLSHSTLVIYNTFISICPSKLTCNYYTPVNATPQVDDGQPWDSHKDPLHVWDSDMTLLNNIAPGKFWH